MNMNHKWMPFLFLILGALMVSGCAISRDSMMAYDDAKATFQRATAAGAKECAPVQYATAEAYLGSADEEIGERHDDVHLRTAIQVVKQKSEEALKMTPCKKEAAPAPAPKRCEDVIPPTAKAGECYARILVPERYQTFTERVLVQQASETIEAIPPKFEEVEQRVLVKEASKRFEEVPAEYGWVEERMLVEAAHTEWKKGRGLVEKIDQATGEIWCLIETPAKYETVRKRVVTKPATIRQIDIPAEYETVKVTKMVSPPQEKHTPIPEQYATITKREKVADSCWEWRKVVCETNMSPEVIKKIQEALVKQGYNPGPIDGTFGTDTSSALTSYQKDKGLAQGECSYETLESLGIKID